MNAAYTHYCLMADTCLNAACTHCAAPLCRAVVNRYGFNSLGADAVQDNLEAFCAKAIKHPDIKPGGWWPWWAFAIQ